MKQTEIFYFFFPDALCSRVRRGRFDVLEDLYVKHRASGVAADQATAMPAVAKAGPGGVWSWPPRTQRTQP